MTTQAEPNHATKIVDPAEIQFLTDAPDTVAVDTRLAAAFLGLEASTLQVWRSTQRQKIPFLKMGRSVRYLMADLRKFRDESRVGV